MGLFSKIKDSASAAIHNETRNCPICGSEIKFIKGYTELVDANVCKKCSGKKSEYWNISKKTTTLDMLEEHLAYRERNAEMIERFTPTLILGKNDKVYLDENHSRFFISNRINWKEQNPDILTYDMVSGVLVDVNESKTELYRKDPEGNSIPYSPSQYNYSYSVELTLHVNHPYFDQIRFDPCYSVYIKNEVVNENVQMQTPPPPAPQQNNHAPNQARGAATNPNAKGANVTRAPQAAQHRTVSQPPHMPPRPPMHNRLTHTWKPDLENNVDYQEMLAVANEIRDILTEARIQGREEHKLICPYCDKTGTPLPDGSCPFCGAPME